MSYNLSYNTVIPLLRSTLELLMQEKLFSPFRLVGGTSLSLQIGHRMSDDIDLFTDELYGSIDFKPIDEYLRSHFDYVECSEIAPIAFGKMYRVGRSKADSIKLDLMYTTEQFVHPIVETDGIRMASIAEITAMKLDILTRGGRKKDFWDLHALTDHFTLDQMIALHKKRYPYTHHAGEIRRGFRNFSQADEDFDPQCLLGKHWELIKYDLFEFSQAKK